MQDFKCVACVKSCNIKFDKWERGVYYMRFEIVNNQFLKDGKPIKIISGAVHYFRNMPDTWNEIFKKLKIK